MTSSPDGGELAGKPLRPPGLGLLLAEMRGIFEFNLSLVTAPLLLRARRPGADHLRGLGHARCLSAS